MAVTISFISRSCRAQSRLRRMQASCTTHFAYCTLSVQAHSQPGRHQGWGLILTSHSHRVATTVTWMLLLLLASGCATIYKLPKEAPSGSLSLSVQIDAPGTTLRIIALDILQDETCKDHQYGRRGGFKQELGSPAKMETAPVAILAEEALHIAANYNDARAAQNMTCSVVGSFVPKTNHVYRVRMEVRDKVGSCSAEIFDTTSGKEERVEFRKPEYVCADRGKNKIRNGESIRVNWKVNVVPTPR